MIDIAVVGLGNFGTALSHYFATRGYRVTAWTVDAEVVDSVNKKRVNPKYLSEFTLSENIRATGNIADLQHSDICLLLVPSAALPSVLPKLSVKKGAALVSGIKGLCNDAQTPLQYIRDVLKGDYDAYVLSGPGFARDIVAEKPFGLVLAGHHATTMAEDFSSPALRVYSAEDTLGVELGGILKNVIAIAVGISDGLDLGDSARAGLVTRGLAEMMRLGVAMGAQRQTFFGLSGLGDLVLTATCDTSRNRQVGLALGRGEVLNDILESIGSVAEGVKSAKKIQALGRKFNVELPLTDAVTRIVEDGASVEEVFADLQSRPVKAEF